MEGCAIGTAYVLDTSVIVKWFSEIDESDVDNAYRLRVGMLEGTHSITVPDLLFYELANALRYHPGLSPEEATAAVDAIFDLEFDVRSISPDMATSALHLAYTLNVTVYDASFLALAQKENKTLVTADNRFYEKAKGSKYIARLMDLNKPRKKRNP